MAQELEFDNKSLAERVPQWHQCYLVGGKQRDKFFSNHQKICDEYNDRYSAPKEKANNIDYVSGYYFLKYYYFQPKFDIENPDKTTFEQHEEQRQQALQRAEERLKYYVDNIGVNLNADQKTKKGEAAFQLAWLYLYHPELRYRENATEEASKYLTVARECGHKRATSYYRKRLAATAIGHFTIFALYGAVTVGGIMLAMAAALAWPILAAIAAGGVLAGAAHWFGFKYYHKFHNTMHDKFGHSKFAQLLGIFQKKITNQGSPSAQMRDLLLYNMGVVADRVEAKRGGRYAQFPKGALGGALFLAGLLYFVPALASMPLLIFVGAIVLTLVVGVASGDTNRRVFTAELQNLAETDASPEEPAAENPNQDHKIQRKIARFTNIIYGISMTVTVSVVCFSALIGLATAVAAGPFFIPALILMAPLFAAAIYAGYVVGRGYYALSYLTWLKNIEDNWNTLNLNRGLNGSSEPVSVSEKIFGVIGYILAIPVAISLALLGIMELHALFNFIPGANNWLFAGGTIGGVGGIGTAILYVDNIVGTFRQIGQLVSKLPEKLSWKSIQAFAKSPMDILSTFRGIRKASTLSLNASGNSFISAVPALKLITGAIILGFVVPNPVVLPVVIVVSVFAGIASLCVCSMNWGKAMDAADPNKPMAAQLYDRNFINWFCNVILSVPAAAITLAVLFPKAIMKLAAKAAVWFAGQVGANKKGKVVADIKSGKKDEVNSSYSYSQRSLSKGHEENAKHNQEQQPSKGHDANDLPSENEQNNLSGSKNYKQKQIDWNNQGLFSKQDDKGEAANDTGHTPYESFEPPVDQDTVKCCAVQ